MDEMDKLSLRLYAERAGSVMLPKVTNAAAVLGIFPGPFPLLRAVMDIPQIMAAGTYVPSLDVIGFAHAASPTGRKHDAQLFLDLQTCHAHTADESMIQTIVSIYGPRD